jgi:hypothetical protein
MNGKGDTMNDYEEIENDDRLALRLRREARRSRPAFSAVLHERVLATIRAASAPAPAATVQARRGSRGQAISWALTAAATIALMLAIALLLNHARSPSRESVAGGGPAAPGKGIGGKLPGAASTETSKPQDVTAKKDAEDFDAAAEELANSASGIGDWVRSAAGDSQWGGLDRDAERALAAVAGPLPFDLTFSLASADAD